MRFCYMLGAMVMALCASGLAQSQPPKFYKARPSTEFKVKDPANQTKGSQSYVPAGQNAASVSAKNLQSIEHQTIKGSANPSAKKVSASLPKLDTGKPAPAIDIKGSGEGRASGAGGPAPNALQGRLKQKGSSHN